MSRFQILVFAVTLILLPTASSKAAAPSSIVNTGISFEDVDTNRDGNISPDESRSYIGRLEMEHRRQTELSRQTVEKPPAPNPVKRAAAPVIVKGPVLPVPAAPAPTQPVLAKERTVSPYIQKIYDRRTNEMKAFDKNKDGTLQVEELKASSQQKFDAADANKDGKLSRDETALLVKQANGDRRAIGPEANRVKNRFSSSDLDDDGVVSKEEYSQYMGNHQQNFDRDGDGKISKEEYRMDGEKLPSSYLRTRKMK